MAIITQMPRDLPAGPTPPSTTTSRAPPAASTTAATITSSTPSFLKTTDLQARIRREQRRAAFLAGRATPASNVTHEPPSSNFKPRRDAVNRNELAPYTEPVPAPGSRAPESGLGAKRRRLSMNQTHALPPKPDVPTPPTPSVGFAAQRQSQWPSKAASTGPRATGANAIGVNATASRMPLLSDALARAKAGQQGNRSPRQQLPGWQTLQHHEQQQSYGYAAYPQGQYAQGQYAHAQPQQHYDYAPPQPQQGCGYVPPQLGHSYAPPQQYGQRSLAQQGFQSPSYRGGQSPYQGAVSGSRSPAVQARPPGNSSPLPLGQGRTASGGNTPRPLSGGRTPPPPPPLVPLPSRAAPAPRRDSRGSEGAEAPPRSAGAPLTPPHSPTPPPPPPSQSPPPPPPSKPMTPTPASKAVTSTPASAGMRALDKALEGLRKQSAQKTSMLATTQTKPSAPSAPPAADLSIKEHAERIAAAAEDLRDKPAHINLDTIEENLEALLAAVKGQRGELGRTYFCPTVLTSATGNKPPSPISAAETRENEREASPRPAKGSRAPSPSPHVYGSSDSAAAAAAAPEPLFFDAPLEHFKLEDEDFGALPNVPTQDELFGSEPGEEEDREPLFEDEEEDELDSDDDDDVKPYIDPRRQNPDMDVSDSEDDDSETDDDADEINVNAPISPDAPIDVNDPAPSPKKRKRTTKLAKRAKRTSEAIFAGQCLRCPNQPRFTDMYNHLCLDHRHDVLSPSDFVCDKIMLCPCGRPAIRSTYMRNHLKFCELPLERRVAIGMAAPKEKRAPASKAGRCNLCSKSLKDIYGHFRRKHANIQVTNDDFECDALKACCGQVWTKASSRHKCADSSTFTRPSNPASQSSRAQATDGLKSTTAQKRGQAPNAARTINRNDNGRNRRDSGEGGRPGELPDRLQFLNRL